MASLSDLDADIAAEMLTALMAGEKEPPKSAPIPISEQKKYIKLHAAGLAVAGRKSIGNIIIMNGHKSQLQESGEGVVINLDALPDNVIGQIYEFMLYKKSAH